MKTSKKNQQGFFVIVALIVIAVFGVLGIFAAYLVNVDTLNTVNQLGSQQALYLADSGLESAIHQLVSGNIASGTTCGSLTGTSSLTNYTVAGSAGTFTVTGTGPQLPTASTLNSTITGNSTTIPLNNASSYSSAGRILIDSEAIDYVLKSGNNFLNVQRGADGTTATAHAAGTAVGQYQCTLTSQSGVPNLSLTGPSAGGKRSLQTSVQLADVFAVGSNGTAQRWNAPTENQWNAMSIPVNNADLNAVFALSDADAWAVGNKVSKSFVLFHWDGNTWSAFDGPGSSQNMYGVYCINSNDCHAVGNSSTLLGWNGNSWGNDNTGSIPNTTLHAIYCNASNDCWAVGDKAGGNNVFLHWNGTSWTQDSSSTGPTGNFNAIWCTASNNCWTVGDARAFAFWNGSSWVVSTMTSLPNVTYLGVTCTASNNCWAVGNRNSGISTTVHWNGSGWAQDTSPPVNVKLSGISCSRANDCWAVGDNGTTIHWDGAQWTNIPTGLPNSNDFSGVSVLGYHTKPSSAWQEIFP